MFKILEDEHLDQAIEQELDGVPWLSPYLPTTQGSIDAFFRFAGVSATDTIVDIGCGDGRVLVTAAKVIGCRGIGIDISQACIDLAFAVGEAEGVSGLISWHCADATLPRAFDDLGLASASVVYLYAYPTLLTKLQGLLVKIAERARVFTLQYHMDHLEGWEPFLSCTEPSMRLYRPFRRA
ncbi:unnamed protein product [Choristocarpus tenellus]